MSLTAAAGQKRGRANPQFREMLVFPAFSPHFSLVSCENNPTDLRFVSHTVDIKRE